MPNEPTPDALRRWGEQVRRAGHEVDAQRYAAAADAWDRDLKEIDLQREVIGSLNDTVAGAGSVEIRRNDDGSIDEIVGTGVMVHIEDMGGSWFVQVGNRRFSLSDAAQKCAEAIIHGLEEQIRSLEDWLPETTAVDQGED